MKKALQSLVEIILFLVLLIILYNGAFPDENGKFKGPGEIIREITEILFDEKETPIADENTFLKYKPTEEPADGFQLVLKSLWQSVSEKYVNFSPLLLYNETKTVVLVQLYVPDDIAAAVKEDLANEADNWRKLGTALAEDSGAGQELFAGRNCYIDVYYTLLEDKAGFDKLLQACNGELIFDIIPQS